MLPTGLYSQKHSSRTYAIRVTATKLFALLGLGGCIYPAQGEMERRGLKSERKPLASTSRAAVQSKQLGVTRP